LIIATWLGLRLWRPAPYEPSAAARSYYDKGVDALHAATYFQASKALKQAVDLDREYAPAHTRLAEAYLEINSTEQAGRELLEAVSLAGRRALSSRDKLGLDAVDAMARRDFPAAVGSYQKILNQTSAADKANAYVDLGRAYERNEQLDKAIENYLNATRADPQSAGASLHLGIANSKRRDVQTAAAAFDRAEHIY
jgi:Tfp pilus assembly protein PilF